jgi:hypothetical protein
MVSLINLLKEIYLTEGGNVFKNTEYDTENILLANIEPTIKKFVEDLGRLFPNKKSTFNSLNDKSNWLGSTGNKPQSGDVDLAYSSEYLFKDGKADTKGWGVDQNEFNTLYEKYKKSSRSATDEAIQVRALLDLIISKINNASGDMFGSNKATNGGTLHFSYPQYDTSGKKLDSRAQLDIDTGDMDWLKFRYNSELPKDNPNIKGLHRGQLMLAMFAATGYTFKSGKGFIRKETGEIIANKPQEALEVFNQEYKSKEPLTLEIVNNYDKLMNYINNNLKPEDQTKTLDLFRDALKRAGAYIPDNI